MNLRSSILSLGLVLSIVMLTITSTSTRISQCRDGAVRIYRFGRGRWSHEPDGHGSGS